MAGNQPRLRATAFDPKTGDLQFEFLDATNLASPDEGHMRRARYRFEDPKHFTTEWEFFQQGKRAFSEATRFARTGP